MILFVFVLLITVPFSNQAFHIDDAIFWDFAKQNLQHPISMHVDDYHLMGEDFGEWRDTHPPIDYFYMALLMRLTGSDAERPLHLGFIVFPLIAGVSMYFLARKFTRNALLTALILLATPAVMTMSHTLMADAPLMAVWLAATATYIYGVDKDDMRLLLLSAFLTTLAIFTGYQALALLLFLQVYPLLNNRLSRRNALPLALPVAAFLIFIFYHLIHCGQLPRFSHAHGTSENPSYVLDRIEGMFLQIGGTSIFPIALAGFFSLRRKRYITLLVIALAATGIGLYRYHNGDLLPLPAIMYALFLTASVTAIFAVVSESYINLKNAVQRRHVDTDFLFLAFWMLVMMVATIILLPHATAKYTLIITPPLIILAIRELDITLSPDNARRLAITALVLTFLTGTAVSIGDYKLAATYKDYVADFASRNDNAGTTWFIGEWGFRHYMEAQGYRYLSSNNDSLSTGDLIVKPSVADWPLAKDIEARRFLIETDASGWSIPLRLMSFKANAGFYGSYWGLLPYSIADVPVETFEVFKVGPPPLSAGPP